MPWQEFGKIFSSFIYLRENKSVRDIKALASILSQYYYVCPISETAGKKTFFFLSCLWRASLGGLLRDQSAFSVQIGGTKKKIKD